LKIGKIKNKYFVFSAYNAKSVIQPLWIAIRDFKEPTGHEIKQGDIFKMGRVKYYVKEFVPKMENIETPKKEALSQDVDAVRVEIVSDMPIERTATSAIGFSMIGTQIGNIKKENDTDEENKKQKINNPDEENTKKISEIPRCRICLEDSTFDNPLIDSPCKCTGTIKLVHPKCLSQWLKSKVIERKSLAVTTYAWKSFECDLCKTKYPQEILLADGSHLNIFDLQKPTDNYMVLQEVNMLSENTIHIINISKKQTLRIVFFIFQSYEKGKITWNRS